MLAPSLQPEPERPYRPRAPALGFFHRLDREHLPAFLELRPDLPRHVVEAFETFLDCGILANGFTRLRCGGCGFEQLLPFSCKGRLCPSCNTRKMHETAAHLVDRVLPFAGYRQWVLSLPRKVRYLLVTRKELVGPVLGVFSRETDTAPIVFHPLDAPTTDDLDELALKLWRKISKKLKALGAWEPELEDELDPERMELGRSIGEQLVAFDPDAEPFERKGLSAFRFGYSLHAGVAVEADDRKGLERILRYGLRPPFAEDRLEEGPNGEIYYKLRKPLRDGRNTLLLEPLDLLRKMATFVPPKGQNLVRYHGVFAPNSKHRPAIALLAARTANPPLPPGEDQITPLPSPTGRGAGGEGEGDRQTNPPSFTTPPFEVRPRRINWADLLKRVFEADVTTCGNCGGKVEVLAVITDPAVIRRILEHLRLPTAPPARGAVTLNARGPPGEGFDEGPSIDDLLLDEQP